jgi:hypothetical protein
MSYGLKILSANGRTVINTDEYFVGQKIRGTSAINISTAGTSWPPTGLLTEELPLCRTKSGTSGVIGLYYGEFGLTQPTFVPQTYGAPSNGLEWWPLAKQVATTGGYGLKVFNSSGGLAFDGSDVGIGIEIVAAGTLTAKTGTFTMEAGRDPLRYVVDVSNSSMSLTPVYQGFPNPSVAYYIVNERSYYFDRTNDKIILRNWSYPTNNPSNTSGTGAPFEYLIGYLLY